MLPSFTHHHNVPNLYDFLLWKTKEDILKNIGNHWLPLYGQIKNKQANKQKQKSTSQYVIMSAEMMTEL